MENFDCLNITTKTKKIRKPWFTGQRPRYSGKSYSFDMYEIRVLESGGKIIKGRTEFYLSSTATPISFPLS